MKSFDRFVLLVTFEKLNEWKKDDPSPLYSNNSLERTAGYVAIPVIYCLLGKYKRSFPLQKSEKQRIKDTARRIKKQRLIFTEKRQLCPSRKTQCPC